MDTVWSKWHKSSFSNANGCVEVRSAGDGSRQVRDTKDAGTGPVLNFNAEEWSAFTQGVRSGEFDA